MRRTAESTSAATELPPGLALGGRNKAEWDQPQRRRSGLRNLYRVHRYGVSLRAPLCLRLDAGEDLRLAELAPVRAYLQHPYFCGLLVLRGGRIALERYSADFGAQSVHSIQSITKTAVHLIAGRLVEAGRLDMSAPVAAYVPQIGPGYAEAPVQALFDMAVINDYTEDYYDPRASVGDYENAHGWRIDPAHAPRTIREFLLSIGGEGRADPSRRLHYKTANTDLAAWICELCAEVDLRTLILEIVEAAGVQSAVFLSTDRAGVPFLGGGLHMTLRDLARYGLLLARGGDGLGRTVGSPAFAAATRSHCESGTVSLTGRGHYRNFTESNGRWLGHNGYGGQWLMAFPEQDIVIACLSAIADDGGLDWKFIADLRDMGEHIAEVLNR